MHLDAGVVGAVQRGSLEHITSYRFAQDEGISNSIAIDEVRP